MSVQDMKTRNVVSHYFAMKIEMGDVGNEQMRQGLYVADLIRHY